MSRQPEKRITIITGHYGSGKTEIAVNFTLQLKDDYQELALVDLDFVNPYFRSREAKEYLNSRGITVIASAAECFNTDLPAFSPQIGGVLGSPAMRVVVDLGGDETGARAIGRFRNKIADNEYDLLFVINPFRPFTTTTEEIDLIIRQIETSSRLKVTAFISNPHLMTETTVRDILSGHETVCKTARTLDIPVKIIAVEQRFGHLPEITGLKMPVLNLTRQMMTPWERPG